MRIVLGTIAAFVSMSAFIFALSIAPWYLFGIDRVLEPGRFETIPLVGIYSLTVSFVGAFLGGLIARKIGRSMTAVFAVALLGLAGGIVNAIGQSNKPEPGVRPADVGVMQAVAIRKEPGWYTTVVPIIGVTGVLLGGRSARQQR